MADSANLYNLEQGDKIRVFNKDSQVVGTGAFIRVEGFILVWVDLEANMQFTDMRVSSIKKLI